MSSVCFLLLLCFILVCFFFFSSRRRHTRCLSDWSSDVCSSDLLARRRSGGGQSARRAAMCAVRLRPARAAAGGAVPGVRNAARPVALRRLPPAPAGLVAPNARVGRVDRKSVV